MVPPGRKSTLRHAGSLRLGRQGLQALLSDTDIGIVSPVTAKVSEFYKQVKQPIFPRSEEND